MAPTSKTSKAVKKATAKKTAKKNAVRTVKHGNVTYSSRPQENPGCSPRCTPPYRYVSQATGLKTTTVKYRHRNLAITSPDTVPKKRAATKKTATKKTASKTAKAPSKTVKTVKKAPAKTAVKKTAVKTVKAPAVKKAPAKKTASKTVSCGCAVTPAKTPSKPKTVTCGCAQTPAQVKKAILNKAEKEGMNRKELDRHIIVATIPKIEAKEPIKAPASWKVPTVGGKFEGKAVNTNVGATLDKNTLFKMRTRAMSANLEDWEREVLSRPYINVYYNPSRDKYLINGSRTKDSADDLTPAEAVQKLKTIGSVKPVIMNPHDPFRGRHANKSDIIAVLMTRPDYAPAMNRAVKKNAKAIKIPASWKVPTVGGKFEGKAEPIKAPASWKVPTVGGRFEGKTEPAKRTYTSRNPLILNVNGEPYYVWEEFKGFKGSKENPDQMVVNARAILDFNRRQGFNSIQDVVDYINKYFVKPTPTPAKTAAKSTAKSTSKEVTIRMSAPLSVQKRVLAKKNAMAKAKEVPDLLDPERPRADPYGLEGKEDPLAKVAFAHIYSLRDAERIDMPSKIYQVVEHNGKYYVMDGKQIASLKKDTKQEAFELAMRMARTYKGRVMAQFKVPKSNPPRYRFKTIG